jgi:hypothetical protein
MCVDGTGVLFVCLLTPVRGRRRRRFVRMRQETMRAERFSAGTEEMARANCSLSPTG